MQTEYIMSGAARRREGMEGIVEYRGPINNCVLLEPKKLEQTASRLAAGWLSSDPSPKFK
jgi:hypothetical protein